MKEHPFFLVGKLKWDEVRAKKLAVPFPYTKKILVQNIPDEKVYGRGAYDESLKSLNRVNEWSYMPKPEDNQLLSKQAKYAAQSNKF